MRREPVVNFLSVIWVLQDLHGVKETDPFWLLPGALTGREAGRPRVVWLIRSSAISGGRRRSQPAFIMIMIMKLVSVWRRAQTPHQMTRVLHGGETNKNGFAALGKAIGTRKSTDKDCAYVTDHPVLKYLRPKLANFLNDFLRHQVCAKSAKCASCSLNAHFS
jgi:hypothetical protein